MCSDKGGRQKGAAVACYMSNQFCFDGGLLHGSLHGSTWLYMALLLLNNSHNTRTTYYMRAHMSSIREQHTELCHCHQC